jgi:hypothetical protein
MWRVFERTLEPYQIAEDIPDSHLRNLMLPGCLGRPVGSNISRSPDHSFSGNIASGGDEAGK